MLQNPGAFWSITLAVIAAIFLILFFRWLGQRARKTRYSKKLFLGQLYSGAKKEILESSSVDGDLVTEGASLFFSYKRMGGKNAGTRAVCIKLGDLDYFIARGMPDKTAQFNKTCTVKLYANGILFFVIVLADCKLEGRCITGLEENGSDFSMVFGYGLTVFMDYS